MLMGKQRSLPEAHISPLNDPVRLQMLGDAQSINYCKRILQVGNSVRFLYVLGMLILLPMLLHSGDDKCFIWQVDWHGYGDVLAVSGLYLLVIAAIGVFSIGKYRKNKLFLINALADASLLMLFFLILGPEHNWDFVMMSYALTLLISIMTLNFFQCVVFAVVFYGECMLALLLQQVFLEVHFPFWASASWSENLQIVESSVVRQLDDLPSSSLVFLGVAFLLVLVGYLASEARENRIQANINSVSVAQLRQLNDTIFSDLPTALIVINLAGEIITMNRRARRLFHLHENHQLPYLLETLNPEIAYRRERWENLLQNGLMPLDIHGRTYSVEFTSITIKNYAPLVMISLDNIESIYQRVRETRLASLGRLTAGIAHEIRNPLGSVQSANELIAEASTCRQIQYLTEKIAGNTKRINAIISDILNMFTDQESNMQLLDLNTFLREAVENSRADDTLEFVPITIRSEESTGFHVYFDPGHLSQILHNLMLNAILHGARVNVAMTLVTRISRGGRFVFLEIIDNGVGVAESDREKIFEPFYSGRKSVGLGLYLVREMCLANQAEIEYVAQNEGGACFRITMQCYLPDKEVTRKGERKRTWQPH